MPTQQTVSLRDLQRLADISDRARLRERGEPLPWSVLHDLAGLVPCDEVGFIAYNPHTHIGFEDQAIASDDDQPAADPEELLAIFWRNFWTWPASYPERTGDSAIVIRDSDFSMSRRARATKGEFLRLAERRHSLVVPLSPYGSVTHRIMLWRRDGRGFSDRELLLLRLIRPHLAELRDAGFRGRRAGRDLTPRQRELLRLVGGGQTNRQIGRHLHISEDTVRKHLENAYARLGVSNRIAAVELAFAEQAD